MSVPEKMNTMSNELLNFQEALYTRQLDIKHPHVARALLDPLILLCVSNEIKTGYCINKSIRLTTGLRVSYGTLYPHISALLKDGFLTGSKRISDQSGLLVRDLQLTEKGTELLNSIFPVVK